MFYVFKVFIILFLSCMPYILGDKFSMSIFLFWADSEL